MSNEPIHVWLSWASWLFGVRFSRSEIGICFGPLQVSIMPAHFRADKGGEVIDVLGTNDIPEKIAMCERAEEAES